MNKYYIINKSAGYAVKSYTDEETARNYAERCCKANNNSNYFVAVYLGGMFQEI